MHGSFLLGAPFVTAEDAPLFAVTPPIAPVGDHAREPSLSTLPDGRIVMSWTEGNNAVQMALFDGTSWTEARTIHQSETLFVNWVDFPSVVGLSDGTLAVHWLELNGPDSYQYDVKIAFSFDEGLNWTTPIIPHDDRSKGNPPIFEGPAE